MGADDSLGVAIMAVLEANDLKHGPLEAITKDEETGMYGAFGLKPGTLNGEILLNLTRGRRELYISCAVRRHRYYSYIGI